VSTIAFCPYFELGHIVPTLRLAQGLQSAGHRVVYSTVPDFQNTLEALGFETVALMPDHFPAGTLARLHRMSHVEHEALSVEMSVAFLRVLLDDEFDEHLQVLAPDVLLADNLLYGLLMAAHPRNILCYRVSTALADAPAPGVPPLTTSLPYGDTPERRVAAEHAWHGLLSAAPSELDQQYMRLDRQISEKYGIPADALQKGTFGPSLHTVPELVLCSSAFDFPRPASELRHYIESLALERAPVAFPWHRLSPDRPLVFCSLGSQSYRIPGALRFLSEVVAAAASRSDWQFVVALGSRWSDGDFRAVPDNAVMVPFAPQEHLLPRSSLVITHAGLGTIKESIYFGVPMLAFPLLYDQPGNGARIAYHGLGEVGDFNAVTAPELVEMIDRVLTDRDLPGRMAAMRRSFEELEHRRPGLALIQNALATR
jgi:zeaxanthin glucosyltransferase